MGTTPAFSKRSLSLWLQQREENVKKLSKHTVQDPLPPFQYSITHRIQEAGLTTNQESFVAANSAYHVVVSGLVGALVAPKRLPRWEHQPADLARPAKRDVFFHRALFDRRGLGALLLLLEGGPSALLGVGTLLLLLQKKRNRRSDRGNLQSRATLEVWSDEVPPTLF